MGKRGGKGKAGLFEPIVEWLRKGLKKHHGSPSGHHGNTADMGTRRKWRDPRNHPATPKRKPDAYTPGGDPIYHNDHSTAIGYDSSTMNNFDLVQPKPGYHDVVVHGTNKGHFLPGKIDAGGEGFPGNPTHPNHIADAITGNPNYNGEPVRLISCRSGAPTTTGDIPAAEAVANRLGVLVEAPDVPVGVDPLGGAGQVPSLFSDTGKWIPFHPKS